MSIDWLIPSLHLTPTGSHAGGGKAFMQLCGVDCGPPRLPVLPLSTENMKSLAADLHDIGYYEWS